LTVADEVDGGCIASGQTRTGCIDPPGDSDAYVFYAYAGQAAVVKMARTDPNAKLNPRLEVFDPVGKRIAYADAGGWQGGYIRINGLKLRQTGLYTVVGSGCGTGTGAYGLSLQLTYGPFASQADKEGGLLTSGEVAVGNIDPGGDLDGYGFYAVEGQGVVVQVASRGTSRFLGTLEVYDPTGTRVDAVDDCWWEYGHFRLDSIQTKMSGIYTIVLGGCGSSTGECWISVSQSPPIRPEDLCPWNPVPGNGQAVPYGIRTLAWQPVSGATGYDAYLAAGPCSPLEPIAENVPVASVNVGIITAQGVYFWQVVAHRPEGDVKGPVWWFGVEPCEGCRLDLSAVGNGTVSADPPGPTYPCGQQVQVVATPEAGYRLVRWQGSAVDAGKVVIVGLEVVVTVDGNYTLEAVCEPEQAVLQVLYDFTVDNNPGWVMDGQWEFGRPLGQGGQQYGNPDPSRGRTGQNVIGVNLAGDYDAKPSGPYCVVAGPFDLSTAKGVRLRYFRWLNTDEPAYVRSAVEVSVQGMGGRAQWVPIWEHSQRSPIMDKSWVLEDLDLGLADGRKDVYIRWLYQVNPSAYPYSGWNIDDIQLVGYVGGQ